MADRSTAKKTSSKFRNSKCPTSSYTGGERSYHFGDVCHWPRRGYGISRGHILNWNISIVLLIFKSTILLNLHITNQLEVQLTAFFTQTNDLKSTELADAETKLTKNHRYNGIFTELSNQPSLSHLSLTDNLVALDNPPQRPCVESGDFCPSAHRIPPRSPPPGSWRNALWGLLGLGAPKYWKPSGCWNHR